MKGTKYILQLDVYLPDDEADADIDIVHDLLGDSFNAPHELKVICKEEIEFEVEQ